MKRILTLTVNSAVDGGGGVNVSRAIRKLGGEFVAIYLAGGLTGQAFGSLLDREAVEHRAIAIQGWTRENFSALESATGQQYRFVLPGPAVSEAEWTQYLDVVRAFEPAPDFLVASGSLPPGVPDDFYTRLARIACERGMRMILDTSGPALREALRGKLILVKPSLRELRT
jgi:6-phosphofructokinase 2